METPEWFCNELTKKINLPHDNYKKIDARIDFGLKKHNNKFITSYKFKTKDKNNFKFTNLAIPNIEKVKKNINKKKKKNLKSINEKYKDIKKKQTAIKTLNTKIKKEISKIDTVTITKKYRIYPTANQKKIIQNWMKECRKVYNKCVEIYRKDKDFFKDLNFTKLRKNIFQKIYGDKTIEAYQMLGDEIRLFCSNLKSCQTNLERGHIKKFKMNFKSCRNSQSIFIPKKVVKKNSFYQTHMKKIKGLNLNLDKITCDCRLFYDRTTKKYIFSTPIYEKVYRPKDREKVVALDPGEKIFMSYYGLNDFGQIGINMRDKFLKYEGSIKRYQRILGSKKKKDDKTPQKIPKNKEGKPLRNRNKIRRMIRKRYARIRNMTKDLHNKTALFLCTNYERILIPEFKTQNMLNTKVEKEKVKEAFSKGNKVGKKALKNYSKINRLAKRVKFVLNSLSHYKFRQHLLNKAQEYGCEVTIVTEEYTSKTCTKCGKISDIYKEREKNCKCGYKIDRDINGSRNILLKNLNQVIN